MTARRLAVVVALSVAACGGAAAPASAPEGTLARHELHAHGAEESSTEKKLDEVAAIHGAPGPWAVLGYRMSEYALAKLGLERGSFDLEIVHFTPKEVRYSCIADGAAAHSGASLGKLNLSLVDTTVDGVVTVYRNKKTGVTVALRPAASFRERFAETPRAKARELGREVLGMPQDQLFEESPVK